MNSRQRQTLDLINNTLEKEREQTDAKGFVEFMEEAAQEIGPLYEEAMEQLKKERAQK